jgi:hypothetical protein
MAGGSCDQNVSLVRFSYASATLTNTGILPIALVRYIQAKSFQTARKRECQSGSRHPARRPQSSAEEPADGFELGTKLSERGAERDVSVFS